MTDQAADLGELTSAWRGPGTVLIDEPGLTVLPAFVDTHNHLMLAGQNILGVPVSRAGSIPRLVAMIAERAAQTPPGQWIRSAADWHELGLAERRLPTAAELDQATTQHPVLVLRGGDKGGMNSAAPRLAGRAQRGDDPPRAGAGGHRPGYPGHRGRFHRPRRQRRAPRLAPGRGPR